MGAQVLHLRQPLRQPLHLHPHLDQPHLGVTVVGPQLAAVRMMVRSASNSAAVRPVTAVGLHLAAGGTMARLVSTHVAATRWLTAPKSQYERISLQNHQMFSGLSRTITDQRL